MVAHGELGIGTTHGMEANGFVVDVTGGISRTYGRIEDGLVIIKERSGIVRMGGII